MDCFFKELVCSALADEMAIRAAEADRGSRGQGAGTCSTAAQTNGPSERADPKQQTAGQTSSALKTTLARRGLIMENRKSAPKRRQEQRVVDSLHLPACSLAACPPAPILLPLNPSRSATTSEPESGQPARQLDLNGSVSRS